MSILQAFGKGIGGFLLYACLLVAIMMGAAAQFTEHDSLQPVFVGMMADQMSGGMNESQLAEMHSGLVALCELSEEEIIQMPFGEEKLAEDSEEFFGELITINCSQVQAVQAQDIPRMVAADMFDKIYYKEYACEFIECFKEQMGRDEPPLLLFSQKANTFFKQHIKYLWIGAVLGSALLVISLRKIDKILTSFGTCFIIIGVPYFFIGVIKGMLPAQMIALLGPAIDPIISSVAQKLLWIFVTGVVLAVVGVVLGYLEKRKKEK